MLLPTTGTLYSLKVGVNFFKETSVFSSLIRGEEEFEQNSIAMFVEMSNTFQTIMIDHRMVVKYGFMKLMIDEYIGWCPFPVEQSDLACLSKTTSHWDVLEPLMGLT